MRKGSTNNSTRIDTTTKSWIRNVSDEKAAKNGCRFDAERGQYAVDWVQKYCVLYEGEYAGQPMTLKDWQYEATMRLFGWVKHSDRWEREIRRFRSASIWIAKKNGKSPTLAAWGLYLLCGDGEQGQKVYLAARDGNQAREIAGKHAFEMTKLSPSLMAECTLNRNLMQITHEPTRSIMKPISSHDDRAQKGKEGLNGSILIDETHVVDRAFVQRVRRAGISRSEPLHIEVSTAGKDPDGYGYERWEYGSKVETGEFDNEQLFYLAYAAPQDATDDQILKNPVKYGKMANPTWGRIVGEDEYKSDCAESKRSVTEFAEFKMYRLNVWQKSDNPFIRPEKWAECGDTYTLNDVEGWYCYAGLDLARTKDTTALVMVFANPDSNEVRLWPRFWLPEKTAQDLDSVVPYKNWARAGLITLTSGEVCDYSVVLNDIAELHKIHPIQSLAFDPYNAEQLTQKLEAEHDIPRVLFQQTWPNLAPPTDEFERRILDGTLKHPNHPVLNWQLQNAAIRTDPAGNRRVSKRSKNDYRKVDAVQAAIMGLGLIMRQGAPKTSVYETRGLECV